MAPEAVLLDCDGVLVDSLHLWVRAVNGALIHHGIDPLSTPEEQRSIAHLPIEAMLHQRGYDDDVIGHVYRMRNDLIKTLIGECDWRAGAQEFLSALGDAKTPSAVVTNAHALTFDPLHEKLGIRSRVREVVLGDELCPHHYKPDPKGLLLACERLGVDPSHTVFVGDMHTDMEAAHRAGAHGILLKGPFTTPDFASPAYDSFDEISTSLGLNGYGLPTHHA